MYIENVAEDGLRVYKTGINRAVYGNNRLVVPVNHRFSKFTPNLFF
jgi:hypothetical protein